MAAFSAKDRDKSFVVLAHLPLAKLSHQDEQYDFFGPYLCDLKQYNFNDFAGTRDLYSATPPRSVPSLCDESSPSTNTPLSYFSITPTSGRLSGLTDENQIKSSLLIRRPDPSGIKDWEEQHPIVSRPEMDSDQNCQSHDQIGSIIRWLDKATSDASNDKLADSKKAEHAIMYGIDSAEDGAKDIPERDGVCASQAISRRISSNCVGQKTGSETAYTDDSIDFSITQAMIEFHHKAVHELLQEFRQWQAHRNHTSAADFNGPAPVSSSAVVTNTGKENSSNGTSRPKQASSSRGRKRRSDDEDERQPPSKRNKNETLDEAGSRRTLACPFAKRDSRRYWKCLAYKNLNNASRVKGHLQRVHQVPIHCSRCSQTFNTQIERDEHQRQDPPCQTLPPQTWDGIDVIQQQQLKKRLPPKSSEVENWNSIYTILFPESPLPESPFLDDINVLDDTVTMLEWFRQEAPGYVDRQEVPSELRGNEQQMKIFMNNVLNNMINDYPDGCKRASISATHTPRSQGRQTMLLDTPSNNTDSTMATSIECLSPCPRPIAGTLPSCEPLQALLAMDGLHEESDGRYDILQSSMVPTSIAIVPSVTISGTLDVDNFLGISFLQELDLNMLANTPILDSDLSELETSDWK